MTRDTSDWSSIVDLRPARQGHHVGGAEGHRVREREVQVVDVLRPPVRLASTPSTPSAGRGSRALARGHDAGHGTAAVELPVPQREHDHVGEPDRAAGEQQALGVTDALLVHEIDDQSGPRRDVGQADQPDHEEREPRSARERWSRRRGVTMTIATSNATPRPMTSPRGRFATRAASVASSTTATRWRRWPGSTTHPR